MLLSTVGWVVAVPLAAHFAGSAASFRDLKRWILPVWVLGSAISDLTAWFLISIVVDDAGIIARDRLPGAAGSMIAKAVGDENVKHFAYPYAIKVRAIHSS
jgi:hypothetical protein